MALEFCFYVQAATDLERALLIVQSAPSCNDGAFGVRADHFSPRLADSISAEVGFPVAGALTMWMVYERSGEATAGIIQSTLAAARALSASSALYVALDSRIFRRVNGSLECYPACGYWSMERIHWLDADRPMFMLTSSDYPPEQFRAMTASEGDRYSYIIERLDGTEVLEVHSLRVQDRALFIDYELRNTTMGEAEASVLIIVKVLRELLEDRYRATADRLEFRSTKGGQATLPYL